MSGIAAPRIDVHVGDVTGGHVVIGDYNTIQLPEGVKVTVLDVGERPVPRLRAMPLADVPQVRFELLGRRTEMSLVGSCSAESPLQVYGSEGIGKTTLLKAAVGAPVDAREGVVYFSARRRTLDQVLARLYSACWESEVPFVPSPAEVGGFLVGREVLVVVDDCELDRGDLEALLDTAPRCRFVIGSQQRTVWAGGRAEQLRGLDAESGIRLLERELGGVLNPDDRDAGSKVIAQLGAHPQRLIEVAALVQSGRATLTMLAEGAAGVAARIDAQTLTPDERRILVLLGLLDGAALGSDHIGAVANVPQVDEQLAELERRGWVKSASPRYRLIRPLEEQPSDPRPDALAGDLLDRLTSFARGEMQPTAIAEESEAIEAALALAAENRRWGAALSLARASESQLARSEDWASWRHVLIVGLRAARALGDAGAEAHMLHQLGSLALCLGVHDQALTQLREALRIRERVGDEAGADLTRHNLRQLDAGGPGANGGGGPPNPRWPLGRLVLAIAAVITAAMFALIALAHGSSHSTVVAGPRIDISQPRDGTTYGAGDVVRASYSCMPGRNAKLASCRGTVSNGRPINSATGTHTFEVVATEQTGRTAIKQVTYRVSRASADTTAPTISIGSPKDRAPYAEGAQVAAQYSCTDESGGSWLVSCGGTVANGLSLDTSSLGQHTFTVTATDKAGNRSNRSVTYTVSSGDTTAPTISIGSPKDRAQYAQDKQVTAQYSCTDESGGSGLVSCGGTVANGLSLDTSSLGQHTFTVTATEQTGRTAITQVTYTVMPGLR